VGKGNVWRFILMGQSGAAFALDAAAGMVMVGPV
jgi:hypothetical protein